jgi:hypothetical protein
VNRPYFVRPQRKNGSIGWNLFVVIVGSLDDTRNFGSSSHHSRFQPDCSGEQQLLSSSLAAPTRSLNSRSSSLCWSRMLLGKTTIATTCLEAEGHLVEARVAPFSWCLFHPLDHVDNILSFFLEKDG